MQKIWDKSNIPLPFTDNIMPSGTATNSYVEWTMDSLAAPDITNAHAEAEDASGNDASGGNRVGNHCQISLKNIQVTERAQATRNIGRSNELGYQLKKKQRELYRDIEAISLTGQASVAPADDNAAGYSAGLSAWLTSNDDNGTNGAATGFNTSTRSRLLFRMSTATAATPRS